MREALLMACLFLSALIESVLFLGFPGGAFSVGILSMMTEGKVGVEIGADSYLKLVII